jgi:hypothetical protein
MSLLDEYPRTRRDLAARLRQLLERVAGLGPEEREALARAINDMADKAHDLDEIVRRLTEQELGAAELGDLLIAFELTTEQLRGNSDDIDGKLYEIGDQLKSEALPGERVPAGSSADALPGKRGRYLLSLGEPILPDGPKWVHFSWLGESFCIRDFLGGRELRQQPGLTASDVWRAARQRRPATGIYFVPVSDVKRWRELLEVLPAEPSTA